MLARNEYKPEFQQLIHGALSGSAKEFFAFLAWIVLEKDTSFYLISIDRSVYADFSTQKDRKTILSEKNFIDLIEIFTFTHYIRESDQKGIYHINPAFIDLINKHKKRA
jgi:hypothetical protein